MVKQCFYKIILGVYLLFMLYSCVVMTCVANLYKSYLDFYRILDQKYRLPSSKCSRSVNAFRRPVHVLSLMESMN